MADAVNVDLQHPQDHNNPLQDIDGRAATRFETESAGEISVAKANAIAADLRRFWRYTGIVPGTKQAYLAVFGCTVWVLSIFSLPRAMGFQLGLDTRANCGITASLVTTGLNLIGKHVALWMNPITRVAGTSTKSETETHSIHSNGSEVERQLYALSTLFGDESEVDAIRWWFTWFVVRFTWFALLTVTWFLAVPVALFLLDGNDAAAFVSGVIVPAVLIFFGSIGIFSACAATNTFIWSNMIVVRNVTCFAKELRRLSSNGIVDNFPEWSSLPTRGHLRTMLGPISVEEDRVEVHANFALTTKKYGLLKRLVNEHNQAWELYFLAAEPMLILCSIFWSVVAYEACQPLFKRVTFLALARAYLAIGFFGFCASYGPMVWFSAARITAVSSDLEKTMHEVMVDLVAAESAQQSARGRPDDISSTAPSIEDDSISKIRADVINAQNLYDVIKNGAPSAHSAVHASLS
jgi:hypothetical protein